jgi:hypothetical protein
MRRGAGFLLLCGWLAGTTARAAPPVLGVEITAPHGGIVAGATVSFEARVTDPAVRTAVLVVNGTSYEVPVAGGLVRQEVVAVPGNNRVGIVVARGREVARDSVTFRSGADAMDLVVLLTWAARGEIIDLWVREPGGETCKWDHRGTRTGGHLLDFSADAIGFGSQAYVLPRAPAGRFRLKVHYWGAFAQEDERGWWTYEDALRRLDEVEERLPAARGADGARLAAERRRLQERLDHWAAAAPPQTPLHAEVVAFPGSRAERRWRFDLTVQRTGQLLTLGEVEVSDAMIEAARREPR